MAPMTYDRPSPASGVSVPPAEGTERTPLFEAADVHGGAAGDGDDDDSFGEGDGEKTQIVSAAYELRPRFTGRSGAITRLQALLDQAFDQRQLGFAVIVGEPGMGKSRILGELSTRLKAQHPDALILSGAADENASTYGPISRALTVRYGIVPGEAADESRDKIQAGVAEVLPAQRVPEVAHLIAHLLRVPFEDSPVTTPLLDAPQRLEARLFMALKRLIAAEAERHPVLLVVENLELCTPDTINFIHYIANGMREHRVAVVSTGTAALYERHPAFGAGELPPEKVELGALSASEAEALLRELCKPLHEIPAVLVAHVRTLGGSPRAVHELVRLLLESDVIVREGMIWRIDPAHLGALRLPKTYDELVAARLRVMDDTARRVVEMAAVVGETSWLDAILALERYGQRTTDPDGPTLAQIAASGDHSRIAVVAAIGKLVEREWLVEIAQSSVAGERELRFAYPNLWTIVYQGIDETRRRSYHAAVARWLELHPEGRGAAAQEEVARHLALAGESRDAATRYRRAAEAARSQFANERAIRLFDRALACIGDHDIAARIHLWHDLGSVYELIGDFEAALGAFERMLRLSWVAASKTKAAVAFNKMGRVWRRKGDLRLALDYLERGLELFRAAGDGRGIAGSLDDIGNSLQMLGRYDEAYQKITEALARRGQGGDKRAIATSLSRLGDVQQDRGQYESALACHQEALDLRREVGDRWGVVVSMTNLATLSFELGDLASARAGWMSALPDAEAIGALPVAAMVLSNLGELALVEGRHEEARSRLESALEIIEDIEDLGLESECCRHLAALEKAQGNTAAAKELAERAFAVAQKAGLREHEAQAYLALGNILATNLFSFGDGISDGETQSPAVAAYEQALEVVRSIGNEAALGKALLAFGRYKLEVGDAADGKDMLRDALMVFSKLGLARPAGEAQQLLAAIV